MRAHTVAAGLLLAALASVVPGTAQETQPAQDTAQPPASQPATPRGWTRGPCVGHLASYATLDLPEGFVFLDADATKRFLEQNQNIPSGSEVGAVIDTRPDTPEWFVVFRYIDSGHVDDADRNRLDADALLKNVTEGTNKSNEIRRQRGWTEMFVDGWSTKPFYDPATNNLTWAIKGHSADGAVINHSVRLLGRTGYIGAQVIADPATGAESVNAFNTLLTGFTFNGGQRYAEFRRGDKLAGYGLAALVGGGATAVALKSGLLQKFWKLIVLVVLAMVGALKKLLGAITGRKPELREGQPPPAGTWQ